MNSFTKHWITVTCAPESIVNFKSHNGNYIDIIREDPRSGKRTAIVLSNDKQVMWVGTNIRQFTKETPMSFSEGSGKIAELLGLYSMKL